MMRADGTKLKNVTPMYKLAAHFMTERTDAMNMTTIYIPVEPMNSYINSKRGTQNSTGHLAVILAAYVRLVAKFPELNRFVVNKKFYARNEISCGMVVLKGGSKDHGTMNKIYFSPEDTINDVTKKLNEYISVNRKPDDETNSTDKVMNLLLKIPGVLTFGLPVIKWCDKHGFLPKSVIDVSPFHASMLVTNLSSIRTNHIYHHVYNFGTTSLSLAIGNQRYQTVMKHGEPQFVKTLPIGIVMDERIASGGYFAMAFRDFERFCQNPEILEKKPEKVEIDPEI